jgi:hypothetical protein
VFAADGSRKLIDAKAEIGSWKGFDGTTWCMHQDKESARDSIRRLRELGQMDGVHLALAHVYLEDTGDEFLKTLFLD